MAQATDVDWWTGSHDDGRTGIFPSSYVKKVDTMVSWWGWKREGLGGVVWWRCGGGLEGL